MPAEQRGRGCGGPVSGCAVKAPGFAAAEGSRRVSSLQSDVKTKWGLGLDTGAAPKLQGTRDYLNLDSPS